MRPAPGVTKSPRWPACVQSACSPSVEPLSTFRRLPDVDITDWPLVNDVGAEFYFKPDAGQLFVSPADATLSPPMDAYAEDIDVAIGVERLERATTIEVQRVSRSWAACGPSSPMGRRWSVPMTKCRISSGWSGRAAMASRPRPALSRVCASLIASGGLPDDVARHGVSLDDLHAASVAQRRHFFSAGPS